MNFAFVVTLVLSLLLKFNFASRRLKLLLALDPLTRNGSTQTAGRWRCSLAAAFSGSLARCDLLCYFSSCLFFVLIALDLVLHTIATFNLGSYMCGYACTFPPCPLCGWAFKVCMTMGMQRAKTASASVMRQTGIVFAFIYDALLVSSTLGTRGVKFKVITHIIFCCSMPSYPPEARI